MAATRNKYPPGPPCECHGVAKRWQKDKGMRAGGGWRCAANRKQEAAKYLEANSERLSEYARRRREEKRARGLCTNCGSEPLSSASRCAYCLSKQAIHDLSRVPCG